MLLPLVLASRQSKLSGATRAGYGHRLLVSAMDHYDSAGFVPRSDSTSIAIAAGICHMAANVVSAILSCTDRRHRVAILGALGVAHVTQHLIDIPPATDGSGTDP